VSGLRAGKIGSVQFILNNWFLVLLLTFSLVGLGLKALGVFLSVLWHEGAHALVAIALGYEVREIELLPFGGVARIERMNEAGSISEIAMAAAGPLASLVAAAAFCFLRKWTDGGEEIWGFLYQANFMLALFNLLPALPLDGGRIARAWLAMRLEYGKATLMVVRMGKFITLGMLLWAGWDFWHSSSINLSALVAAGFFYVTSKQENALARFRHMRIMAGKKRRLIDRSILPAAALAVTNNAILRDIVKSIKAEGYYLLVVIDKDQKIVGVLTETEVWEELPKRGLYARIDEFL